MKSVNPHARHLPKPTGHLEKATINHPHLYSTIYMVGGGAPAPNQTPKPNPKPTSLQQNLRVRAAILEHLCPFWNM